MVGGLAWSVGPDLRCHDADRSSFAPANGPGAVMARGTFLHQPKKQLRIRQRKCRRIRSFFGGNKHRQNLVNGCSANNITEGGQYGTIDAGNTEPEPSA